MTRRFLQFVLFLMILFLAGCQIGQPQVETLEPSIIFTQAAQTIVAGLTQTAPAATTPPPAPLITDTLAPTSTPLPSQTPQPSVTPQMTATSAPGTTPLPNFSTVIDDDFSNKTFWATENNERFGFEYVDDAYRIYVNILNATIWSIREVDMADVSLEVDAAQTEGAEDGYYGIVCRQQDEDNYYALVVSSSGTYGIAKMEDGELEFLQEGTAQAGMINPGEATNRVRADCLGSRLTLYANGNRLLEVEDDDFDSGSIGLVAGTRLEGGVNVLFDNFVVRQPSG